MAFMLQAKRLGDPLQHLGSPALPPYRLPQTEQAARYMLAKRRPASKLSDRQKLAMPSLHLGCSPKFLKTPPILNSNLLRPLNSSPTIPRSPAMPRELAALSESLPAPQYHGRSPRYPVPAPPIPEHGQAKDLPAGMKDLPSDHFRALRRVQAAGGSIYGEFESPRCLELQLEPNGSLGQPPPSMQRTTSAFAGRKIVMRRTPQPHHHQQLGTQFDDDAHVHVHVASRTLQ